MKKKNESTLIILLENKNFCFHFLRVAFIFGFNVPRYLHVIAIYFWTPILNYLFWNLFWMF